MNVVFFGTPAFAAKTLSYLLENGVNIVAVVTQPDRPKGRSKKLAFSAVKDVALAHSLPLLQPEKSSAPESAEILASFQADLFVVVAYGEIVKDNLLNMPKLGCINVHASLLPKYRGAAPIQRCLMNGETEAGITIMHMAKKMDAGDVIEMTKVPITENTRFGELEAQLCDAGCKTLLKVIGDFEKGEVTETPQNHELATFAKKMTTEECEILWEKPARELHNLIRGTSPRPGAWCMVNVKGKSKRMKVLGSQLSLSQGSKPAEIISYGKDGIVIACADGAIKLEELQLEGKKPATAAEFALGIKQDEISF